jgi:hypothetical protein
MLPNVRLMIAATLVSAVLLSFGFGIFAAFRVSHEPFAHLPAPMVPPQLVAENTTTPLAHGFGAGDVIGRQADAPPSGPEIHAAAYAEESEPKAAPDAIAAAVIDHPVAINTQDQPAAETAAAPDVATPEPATPSVAVSELPPPPQAEQHAGDSAAVIPHEQSASEPAAPLPAASNEAPANRMATEEPSKVAGSSEAPPAAAPAADSAPSRVANAEIEPAPTEATGHAEAADSVALASPPDLPLPRERPSIPAAAAAPAPGAPAVRRLTPVAASAKRPRVLIRAIHAPRFPADYYARTQYFQTAEQAYAYGPTGEPQPQVMVRRVVRLPQGGRRFVR